ncbi:hypothetical protein tinsulaeT_13100 [Thalassotalea insulae]|uniref:Uncharacterized protein n=1 Tax=Thalassotalea insulae TaxID=2056778 RepID=A0ABQ6GPR3_9GAMM|nr:retron Ec48 family effector membrane protein [Thalassotalea insulae]GLX77970.1 hypothetical protein tinsulaeT_13100 [Thalassotalea insulae]
MNNLSSIYRTIIITLIGLASYIFISISLSMHDELSLLGLNNVCLSKINCYASFFDTLNKVLKDSIFLFQIAFWIIGVMATRLALVSYMSTISSSKSNIHLSNLKSFKEYVEYLFDSYNFFKFENIDVLKLYNLAFPNSSQGVISLTEKNEYTNWLKDINSQIATSNNMINGKKADSFCYKSHQKSMIKILAKGGFQITPQPRNHYYEVETQLIELLHKVNSEYLRLSKFKFEKRLYV